jgi:hypothetical protein
MNEWLIVLVVAPFVLGMAGEVFQRLILGAKPREMKMFRGWRRWYFATVPLHFLLAGALIGAVGFGFGLPRPDAFGETLGGCILAYAFSGGVAIVGYDTIVKVLQRLIKAIRLS